MGQIAAWFCYLIGGGFLAVVLVGGIYIMVKELRRDRFIDEIFNENKKKSL